MNTNTVLLIIMLARVLTPDLVQVINAIRNKSVGSGLPKPDSVGDMGHPPVA